MPDLTVEPGGPEGQPDNVTPPLTHLARGRSTHARCGALVGEIPLGYLTQDRRRVDCPECTAPQLPAESERRTVSLEVLTTELRTQPQDVELDREKTTWIPDHARVGIVLRDGDAFHVVETDADWIRRHAPVPLLARMLTQAEHYARDGGAELLMPGPDVLAALDGRADATFWTAILSARAEQVQVGWLALDYSAPGTADVVTAVDECKDDTCPWHGNCYVITAGETIHWASWQTFDVRIPCGVAR